MKAVFIYTLSCPITGKPRYVGKTQVPDRRLAAHLSKARSGETKHHCANWIRSLLARDLSPTFEVIFQVPDGESWEHHESRLIAEHKAAGFDLTNSTSGGDGLPHLSPQLRRQMAETRKRTIAANPELRQRISEAMKRVQNEPAMKAKKSARLSSLWGDESARAKMIESMATPEAIANRGAATTKRYEDPEQLRKHAERMAEVWSTPEAKEKQRQRAIATHADVEVHERKRASLKAAYQRPEVKAKNKAQLDEMRQRPEVRKAQSEASKRRWAPENRDATMASLRAAKEKHRAAVTAAWADPEKRANRLAARWTPERRAKQAAELASRRDRMKAHDPATIAKRAESLRASWARRKAAKEPQCHE